MRLLAEGITVAEVARRLSVHRRTVEKWRTTTGGAEALAGAKAEVERTFASTVEAARVKLASAADEATDQLLHVLRNGEPQDKLRAAGMIYDRVGLPRTQRIETPPPPVDLSKLTDDELAAYEALTAKVAVS